MPAHMHWAEPAAELCVYSVAVKPCSWVKMGGGEILLRREILFKRAQDEMIRTDKDADVLLVSPNIFL